MSPMASRALAVAIMVVGVVGPAGARADGCGYGPKPSIAVTSPAGNSINFRPFTVTGTAKGGSCDGVEYPVTNVTVGLWPPLAGGPTAVAVACTGCPGMDVTWTATVTSAEAALPAYYTMDSDAYDAYGRGAHDRRQYFIL